MSARRRRAVSLAGLVGLVAAVPALAGSVGAAAQSVAEPQHHVLRVGDSVEVRGARIGCEVVRRSGRVAIECRRAGPLARTYGTSIDRRGVTAVRFRSSTLAQEILTARHGGSWRACDGKGSRARAAVAGRRCR